MADPVVLGLADLFRALDEFPAKFEQNVLRGALRAGVKVPGLEVKQNAPVDEHGPHPGALKRSYRISTSTRGGVVRATVRVGNKVAFYASWVGKGTRPHTIRPKTKKSMSIGGREFDVVHHPGARPNDWMLQALQSNAQKSLEAVAAYVRSRLNKQGLQAPGPEG